MTQQTASLAVGTRRMSPRAIAVAVVALGLLGVGLWLHSRQELPAAVVAPRYRVAGQKIEIPADSPTWGYIDTVEASLAPALAAEPVPGRVAFDESRSAPVVAPLAGRVDSVNVKIGEHVEARAHLIAVRSAAFVDLHQQIEVLRASEAARRKTVERVKALVDLKAAPEKDLLAAELDLNEAHLTRAGAELKLRSSPIDEASEGSYWLVATRDGVVVQRNVLVGEEVGPERPEPLLVVAQLDEVIVTADVPEHDVAWVRVGDTARVFSPATPDQSVAGTVEYVSEVVDPVRRMINVRLRIANANHALRPNAFVQVAFAAGARQALVVPAEAVVTDDQNSFVFVRSADAPQKLERREVSIGRQREGKVEILHGVTPGERVVTRGAILLLNAVSLAG